ncbi:hypothetical protein Tco_0686495 [Tanacetum coccineum]
MKRPTKGYLGQEVALFPTMLDVSEPSTSPSKITSSPSHSPEPSFEHSPDHTTAVVSLPSPTQPHQHNHHLEQNNIFLHPMNHLSMLFTHMEVLRVVLSEDDEDVEDDSSKQGRKLSDAEVQEKAITETEPIIQEVTPTKVIQDQISCEKGNFEVSTAGATKGTASEVPMVSTVEVNISTTGRTVTYRRSSEEKRTRKDKGKAIMKETDPKKKSKKELEQERLSFAKAIRWQEQMDEE